MPKNAEYTYFLGVKMQKILSNCIDRIDFLRYNYNTHNID